MSGSPSARIALFLLAIMVVVCVCFTGAALAAPVQYSFVTSWGATGTGNGQFTSASGVDVDPFGRVLVSEYTAGARLQWFGPGGVPWYQTFTSSTGGPTYGWLSGIWIDPRTSTTYVGDNSLRKIQVVGAGNYFLFNIGDNSGGGSFAAIRGVALDPWGIVYGSDPSSSTVRTFDTHGGFQGLVGSSSPAQGALDFPYGVDWDYDGRLYVADLNKRAVNAYGPDRSFEASWFVGDVRGMHVDPGGNIFVAQTDRVSRVTSAGVQDSYGSGAEFWALTSVCDDGARHLYVTDGNRNKVTEFFAPVPTIYSGTAGATRYDTAIRISQAAYPRGLVQRSPDGYRTVVVATGADWPDALGASALAGAANGPILLVKRDLPLPDGLDDELERLGAERVVIVGGTGAVSTAVEDALVDALPIQHPAMRIAGSNRYETSRLIAQKVTDWVGGGTAFVATGADFPDALSVSPLAAAKLYPVYLADAKRSFIASMAAAGVGRAIILGGTGVVSQAVEDALKDEFGDTELDVLRWAGGNRYQTSSIIASNALDPGLVGMPMRANRVAFATGATFPDGLAGGVLQSISWGPLLLTRPTALPAEAKAWLAARKDKVYHVRFLGGDGAVSPTVRDEVKAVPLW